MTAFSATDSLRIAIFGSCVSRDTCEFMTDAEVVCYVARQSAIAALGPVGEGRFSSSPLGSAFQAKMFDGDQRADAVVRITASDPDLILVDLVDERRGVWSMPDGTYLTNSIEAYRASIEKHAPTAGARLIRFGSDEHFRLWQRGFRMIMEHLTTLRAPIVLLDIAWAETVAGKPRPAGPRFLAGSAARRLKRGARGMGRAVARGDSLAVAINELLTPDRTSAEQMAREAKRANRQFRRYAVTAAELCDFTVFREARGLRMTAEHRWGSAPFHYRNSDYSSMADEISDIPLRTNND